MRQNRLDIWSRVKGKSKDIPFLKGLIIMIFNVTLSSLTIWAQEAFPATGGNISGNGGSMSYSIGQVVINTNIGTNGSEMQGVQQPYEISVTTALEEINGISLNFKAFPNPATDYINLSVESYYMENLSFQLYDLNGKLIESKKIEGLETIIPMKNYVPSLYYLKVTKDKKEVITFKITKR